MQEHITQKWKIVDISKNDTDKRKSGNVELTYTAWHTAWSLLMTTYPQSKVTVLNRTDATGNIYEYFGNEDVGYCVYVNLKIPEIGYDFTERLAILDSANKPQKIASYEYKTKFDTKQCAGMLIDDINNTIQRCTVKNIARAGLGLNVYQGDFSDVKKEDDYIATQKQQPKQKQTDDDIITKEQKEELEILIEKAGGDKITICNHFKVEALTQLKLSQYQAVKVKCEKTISNTNAN